MGGRCCFNTRDLEFRVYRPAPRLKDVVLTQEQYEKCYIQCLKMTRRMYHRCRLIHADLSEYNILYYNSRVYFIDVSQSVEHDHPNALQFLRKVSRNSFELRMHCNLLIPLQDISNITD